MSEELFYALESVKDLGRGVTREVAMINLTVTLKPLSTALEIQAYQYAAERAGGVPSVEKSGLLVGPEHLYFVKVFMLSRAVCAIEGEPFTPDDVITDEGKKRLVQDVLKDRIYTWSPVVLDYMYTEYNKLQLEVAKENGFEVVSREVLSILEQLLYNKALQQEREESALGDYSGAQKEDEEVAP